ncbi:MAG: NAD-binding protein [Actinobacteria bacterium]|nr:NAD-binding protein [Actinomycetota bacterium]
MAVEQQSVEGRIGRLVFPTKPINAPRQIAIRVVIALACIVITTATVWFERYGYSNEPPGKPLSLLDCLYYTTVTLSTTGYGDIAPISPEARLTNVFVVTPLRLVFLIVLVGTALEALTKSTQYQWRARKWRNTVSDHTVVIGYGVKGRSAVRSLLDSGIPGNRIVVVANDEESIREATEQGVTSVQGDARREPVLMQAGISRARRIIIATDEDATSVLITMLAKRLAPSATIVSAAKETSNAQFLRDSGADGVIVTAEAVGRLLSLSIESPTAGNLMEDLLDSGRGLEMVERSITPEELGLGPDDLDREGELVLAVIRDGHTYRFDEGGVKALNRDDRIVVIRQRPESQGLGDLGAISDEAQ